MNPENDVLISGSADDFDEPYVQTVSTEEFVAAVEQESRTENDDLPPSQADPSGNFGLKAGANKTNHKSPVWDSRCKRADLYGKQRVL